MYGGGLVTEEISDDEDEPMVGTGVRIQSDVDFLEEGREEKMDIYFPAEAAGEKPFPVVLQIHGGGWHKGDKATPREQNIGENLAQAGYVCASINYQLAEHRERFPDRLKQTWPENLHDCMAAVRFLRAHAEEFRIDPDRIAVLGTSAGGHLATMLGTLEEDSDLADSEGVHSDESHRPQAVISLYGVHDFIQFSKTRGLELSDSERALCNEASPVTHLSKDDPPVLIVHGTADGTVPHRQSVLLDKKATQEGVESELHLIPGAKHSFHLEPDQRDLRPLVIDFLDRHLK